MAYTQWLPVSRRGGGEWNTPNITIPAGVKVIRLHLLVAPQDFETPDRSVAISIQVSNDNGVNWRSLLTVGWVGEVPLELPGSTPWTATISNIDLHVGELARAHMSTSGDFRWGLEGEIA